MDFYGLFVTPSYQTKSTWISFDNWINPKLLVNLKYGIANWNTVWVQYEHSLSTVGDVWDDDTDAIYVNACKCG